MLSALLIILFNSSAQEYVIVSVIVISLFKERKGMLVLWFL